MPYYGLKIIIFDGSELGSMIFFKPILDSGLKIWFFNDHESGKEDKNKPIDQSMAQRHGQRCILPECFEF